MIGYDYWCEVFAGVLVGCLAAMLIVAVVALTTPQYYLISEGELDKIATHCTQEQWNESGYKIYPLVKSRPAIISAEQVLDEMEKLVSERIAELKSWMKLAEINRDRKRVLEILPIIGENQALWAQIKELQVERER
jgi:hypothetical protein